MRVMVLMKANKDTEAGVMPGEEVLATMTNFNEELVKAGVMIAGEGLRPSAKGVRVRFSGGKQTITEGPFPETNQLVCGFWIWNVKSMEEAIDWLKRSPMRNAPFVEIELRQIFEAEDFGEEFTPELRDREQRLRVESERLAKSGRERKAS